MHHTGSSRDICIAAVILAAGASRRMGSNKLLLPVDGVPMLRRTVERVRESGCSTVVVVTGHETQAARGSLAGLDVGFAESPDPLGPTSGSLHAGIRALPDDVDALLVMLADMVFVTAEMLRTMRRGLADTQAPLAVSRYGDVLAPPLVFRRALWPELLAWTGEGCGKAVVRAHQSEAHIHDWPVAALRDIDTPEDYRGLA